MNGRTIERLESRLCLSSSHGGDFHFDAMLHGDHAGGAPTTVAPVAPTFQGLRPHAQLAMTKMPQMYGGGGGGMHKLAGGGGGGDGRGHAVDHDGGYEPAGGSVTPVQHAPVIAVAVIPVPGGGVFIVPLFNIPPMTGAGGPAVDAPAPPTSTNSGAPVAQTPATATAPTPPNTTMRDNRIADLSPARQVLSESGDAVARGKSGGGVATASARRATGALGASAGSVMERLTSKWHDGIIAAAVDVAQASIAHLVVSPEALVSRAVDAANNLLAPVAQTAGAVMSAVTPVASVTSVAAYDIAHMGSPFALLADSLAGFVEESASVTNVIAQADKRGPWTLTASVIAADVAVLTYVYRRKSTRRRAQLAMPGVA